MLPESTTDEVVESLLSMHCAHADARTRHLFRQTLYQLIYLAKSEKSLELQQEALPFMSWKHKIPTMNYN
jgi:hypothetical protein